MPAPATLAGMGAVSGRDLRNHTTEIRTGEDLDVIHGNQLVARRSLIRDKRRWIPASEVAIALERLGPDSTNFLAEIRQDLPGTTEDL